MVTLLLCYSLLFHPEVSSLVQNNLMLLIVFVYTHVCRFLLGVYIKMSLTDSKLKKLLNKSYDKPFEVSDRDSLSIRVSAKGKIAWQYRFRFDGKGDRVTIGHYPNLSLAYAREKVPDLRGWLFEGKNPKLEWNAKKHNSTKKSQYTLIKLSRLWLEKVAEVEHKDTTFNNYDTTIGKWICNEPKRDKLKEKWVKKKLDIPYDDISNGQWMDYFDWICREGSQVTSGSVFKLIKTIITWGLKREYISNSNLLIFTVKDVGKTPKLGERTPSIYEISRMWLEIDKSRSLPQTKACLKLIILFGGRNTAIRTAKWKHFDFEKMIWTIPVPKGKKEERRRGTHEEDIAVQRPERHPIPKKAKELLDEIGNIYGKEGYIFKGDVNSQAITTHAINRFCSRMSLKIFTMYGISKITPHDFRRSIESIISEIDVKWLPICEKILGHKLKGTMAHYNKADYIDQQLEVYELYWSLIKKGIDNINNQI